MNKILTYVIITSLSVLAGMKITWELHTVSQNLLESQ